VAQQLCRSAHAWWINYTSSLEVDNRVTWTEFHEAFHTHHIPEGLMSSKQQEFLELTQGSNNVYEYCKRLNYLTQYGAHHIDIDEKKSALFWKGLSSKLCEQLKLFRDLKYNELVNAAIEPEDAIHEHKEEKKGKRAMAGSSGGLTRSTA
jgi:hypothetical protein